MSDVTEAVDRGVELLDRKVPGWREHINLEDFSIESTSNCIVGQLARKTDIEISVETTCGCGCGLLKGSSRVSEFSKWLIDSETFPMWGVELAEYGFYAEYGRQTEFEDAWRAAVQGVAV